jgi:hypothetical protein
MSSIQDLLRTAAAQFEPEVQKQLKGLFGGIVRNYLPQEWVFRTEHEVASLRVDATGHVTVGPTASAHPDVTVEIPHDRLAAALRTRDRKSVPPGPISVTPHTAKGKAAFDYLRARIGL